MTPSCQAVSRPHSLPKPPKSRKNSLHCPLLDGSTSCYSLSYLGWRLSLWGLVLHIPGHNPCHLNVGPLCSPLLCTGYRALAVPVSFSLCAIIQVCKRMEQMHVVRNGSVNICSRSILPWTVNTSCNGVSRRWWLLSLQDINTYLWQLIIIWSQSEYLQHWLPNSY